MRRGIDAELRLSDGKLVEFSITACPKCGARLLEAHVPEGRVHAEWVRFDGSVIGFDPHRCGVAVDHGLPGEEG